MCPAEVLAKQSMTAMNLMPKQCIIINSRSSIEAYVVTTVMIRSILFSFCCGDTGSQVRRTTLCIYRSEEVIGEFSTFNETNPSVPVTVLVMFIEPLSV